VVVVVGAGVVGLASALALARRGRAVCLLERHGGLGLETSTHNSGVIHAGLYYPPASLKATLCVDGRERLYRFCEVNAVPHVRCGKLVVAQEGEHDALSRVATTAAAAGARVVEVDRTFVRAREPHVRASAALWSPDTGWIDAQAYIRRLESSLLKHDGIVLAGTAVIGIEPAPEGGLTVVTPRERIEAERVVNCAGLFAHSISAMAGGEPFQIYPCRGEYAELAPHARALINGLVYPVPHPSGHGLGVHLTKTIGGAVWIGPTIRFQDDPTDYERDRLPLEDFVEPTQAMLPGIQLTDLRLAGSGIRPKLHPPSESFADFMIRADTRNSALVHAAGIDSPGLTASLAIGERVADICEG
jgi:L-2-hydroxyglutarate oxidase LhgO